MQGKKLEPGQQLRHKTSGALHTVLSITGSWVELKKDSSNTIVFLSTYKVHKSYR